MRKFFKRQNRQEETHKKTMARKWKMAFKAFVFQFFSFSFLYLYMIRLLGLIQGRKIGF